MKRYKQKIIKISSQSRLKAFTLLEILVASSIFAIVMVLAVGIIGQVSIYQGKLKAIQNVSKESRKLANQITEDVRSANSPITVTSVNSEVSDENKFKNGLALYKCSDVDSCSAANQNGSYYNGFLSSGTANNANVLIAANDKNYKIYWSSSDGQLHYAKNDYTTTIALSEILSEISGKNISTNFVSINLAGFCPNDGASSTFQPYVDFYITVKTKNYDTLSRNQRYQTNIRSMATSRSYNN